MTLLNWGRILENSDPVWIHLPSCHVSSSLFSRCTMNNSCFIFTTRISVSSILPPCSLRFISKTGICSDVQASEGFCSTDDCIVLLPPASVPLWDRNDLFPANFYLMPTFYLPLNWVRVSIGPGLVSPRHMQDSSNEAVNYSCVLRLWWGTCKD